MVYWINPQQIMTREELVQMREYKVTQASTEYWNKYPKADPISAFEDGVAWADEHPKNPWISVEERLPDAVDSKEFGHRRLSKQVLCVYEDGKCHVVRYDHNCNCWRWANGYGQMHEPKMWQYIDIPEGGTK